MSNNWAIAECVHRIMQDRMRKEIADSPFMTTIDNQTWISIHIYVMKDFVHVPMLLALERVVWGLWI